MEKIVIKRPDDWHIHLRDNDLLSLTVRHVERYYSRSLVMPNLDPPIIDFDSAHSYFSRISSFTSNNFFSPLLTLYLTDNTTLASVKQVASTNFLIAFKLYPKKVTTNSQYGISSLQTIYPVLEEMQRLGVVLCIHGEKNGTDIDPFDREKYFIEDELIQIVKKFPDLKIVFEHITTKEACDFVYEAPHTVAATITPQHLMFNRSDLLGSGIKPHLYCLPILKRNHHQLALLQAATSGNSKFFLGTDSAPHDQSNKETSCGCAGCYSGFASLEMYAQIFEKEKSLSKLEGFASIFGAQFYGQELNQDTVTLVKKPWKVPDYYEVANQKVIPLLAGEYLDWQVQS